MRRLIDDIGDFLKNGGFEHSVQIRHGTDIICVKTPDGKDEKTILPLEVSSMTLKEAVRESEMAEEAVRRICINGEYPIIIAEDRWNKQKEMMQKRILAHLKIFSQAYARNCEARRIEKAEAQSFLEENHSYGYAACKYHYGLFLKRHTGHIAEEMNQSGYGSKEASGELIAVATFSNARRWLKNGKEIRSYEWTRYASLPDMRINGGMGKMLKAFINDVKPDDIMSYADLEWSEGAVYKQLGFSLEGNKSPVSFVIDSKDWSRTAVRKGSSENDGNGCRQEATETTRFFRNFGSNKYRLKLTEYE